MFNWDEYWEQLVDDNNLKAVIEELNAQDLRNGFEKEHTKNICKDIYADFESNRGALNKVKGDFLTIIEQIKNVHSFSCRLKETNSLILKIIRKRYSGYGKRKYREINVSNYKDTLGDIIGMRIILHYQGQWAKIHKEILEIFPEKYEYIPNGMIKHLPDEQFMAEPPKAYYANGDDLSQFENIIVAEAHSKGYRSIHYVISYKNVYVELQMRTIYDEAWSDCDHSYVYKNDANPNNLALTELTKILSKLTNCSSDISELMRSIYFGNLISCVGNEIIVNEEGSCKFEKALSDLKTSESELEQFYNDLKKK